MNLKALWLQLAAGIRKKSPQILTGIGIGAMATGTVLAVKNTPEAMRRIEERKKELHKKKLTVIETVQATWKCYIPSAFSTGIGAGCLLGALSEETKREAMWITLNELGNTRLANHQEAVTELYGEKGEKKVEEKAAEIDMKKHPIDESECSLPVYDAVPENGEELFYFPIRNRYFYCKRKDITDSVLKNNTAMSQSMVPYVSLNDFFAEADLPVFDPRTEGDLGEQLGWNLDRGFIEVDIIPKHIPVVFSNTKQHGSVICNYVQFQRSHEPKYDYRL